MTDFVPSPGAPAPGGLFAPAPPATTLTDMAAADPGPVVAAPLMAGPVIPAAIPAAPPRAAPRRNNAAMAVGIGSIVVAMLGVITFILIRQDRKADDEETEVATIALPPAEPAPVPSAPTEPPAAADPGLDQPPAEPPPTTPPPATAPPKSTTPPKSTAPPKPPPSSTAPPKGSTKPPSGERPKIKVIPRPGSRPPSDKPGSSSSGGATTKRPKLVVKPR